MARESVLREVAESIVEVRQEHTLRVAIDGIDAAGKTTVADELALMIQAQGRPVIRSSIDGFHNPKAVRYLRGRLSPEGYFRESYDLPQVVKSILAPLGPKGDGRYRVAAFDYRVDAPVEAEWRLAPPGSILLFDGIFLGRHELAGYWDLFIFVQISFETCLVRAWERNKHRPVSKEEVIHHYQTRYLPAQRHYLTTYRPMDRADIILYNDDFEQLRVERRE